jgi:hypothetical protein
MSAPAARFALLASGRWVVPLAIAVGLVGTATATGPTGRLVFGGGAAAIAALWALGRWRRPTLIVGPEGYRVVEAGRERLAVAFSEVKRARAVPAELAMYVDCGDPARNLLLPMRHGYGFRFARQDELYVLLAKRLGDRVEIVATLAAADGDAGMGDTGATLRS